MGGIWGRRCNRYCWARWRRLHFGRLGRNSTIIGSGGSQEGEKGMGCQQVGGRFGGLDEETRGQIIQKRHMLTKKNTRYGVVHKILQDVQGRKFPYEISEWVERFETVVSRRQLGQLKFQLLSKIRPGDVQELGVWHVGVNPRRYGSSGNSEGSQGIGGGYLLGHQLGFIH